MFENVASSLSLGILVGLILGKPIGIFSFSWIAVKLKMSKLPVKTRWSQIAGLGLLGGIGFTMSIFIALLSFSEIKFQTQAKFAILLASVFSGIIGFMILKLLGNEKKKSLCKTKNNLI